RNPGGKLAQILLQIAAFVGEDVIHHLGMDLPRTNRIHPEVILSVIGGHAARDLDDCPLAGAVGNMIRLAVESPLRGDVHDRTLSLEFHVSDSSAAQVEK